MSSEEAHAGDSRPTGVVLWLMILVVFVPIAGMHGLARLFADRPPPEATRQAASAPPTVPAALVAR